MKFEVFFHNEARTIATVICRPGFWAAMFGAKARSCLVEHDQHAIWDWQFAIDREHCPRDMAIALNDARRWERLEGLPGARVIQ